MKHCSLLIFIALVLAAAGCIEDGFTAAPAEAPVPAVDSVRLGTVFTDEPTPTRRFTLRNHASKSVSVTSITLGGDHPEYFRLNVDGFSGREFHDVEIRGKDSIYIFVEATLPPNGRDVPVDISATIDILACGVSRSVVVDAQGRDAERLRAARITADTRFTPGKPYIVYDSLVVAPGATLILDAGTELYFHDGSHLAVRGTLKTYGTPEQPVHMTGDRTGNVVADISFDIMSRQWTGVFFTSTSRDNVLTGLDMRNTWQGLYVEGPETSLTLVNCRLHNSAGLVLESVHARTEAVGCEFAEGGEGLVRLQGGMATLNHCTLANYYLFSAISGPALQLAHLSADMDDDTSGLPYLQATVANSIIYGLGSDLSHGDLKDTAVTLDHCLLKSPGKDDDNFLSCLWDTDPLFRNNREKYVFDYRLAAESPAIGAGAPALTDPRTSTDAHGTPRAIPPSLGAYEYLSDPQPEK